MKIMFVCHGNICRSPMAEFIMKDMLASRGIAGVEVSSCAVTSEEIYRGIGNPVYPPASRELALHGIKCDGKRACLLRAEDYGSYDMFIGMDTSNIVKMKRIFGGADPLGKIRMLMDFTPRSGDVADPWYTGDFSAAYRDIRDGCEGLLAHLLEENPVLD